MWAGAYAGGGGVLGGFKHPLWFLFSISLTFLLASERSVMYEDTPTPCMVN